MKFVDFCDEAIECISPKQMQYLIKKETARFKGATKPLPDEKREVTIVCLSYDDGVRYEGNPKPCRARKVLHKELINCHYAEITFVSKTGDEYWSLDLNIKNYFPTSLAKFKTREDAIKAARLCKNAKDIIVASENISREFPEFAADIFGYLKHFENTNNSTI